MIRVGRPWSSARTSVSPAALSGLDPYEVEAYQDARGHGETSRLLHTTGSSPEWSWTGGSGWVEGAYDAGRREVSEQARRGVGWAAESVPGGTEALGDGLNTMTTKGNDMAVSGQEMALYMTLSDHYDAVLRPMMMLAEESGDIEAVLKELEEEIRGYDVLNERLHEKLIKHVRWRAKSS